jgi:hypothetical protein
MCFPECQDIALYTGVAKIEIDTGMILLEILRKGSSDLENDCTAVAPVLLPVFTDP